MPLPLDQTGAGRQLRRPVYRLEVGLGVLLGRLLDWLEERRGWTRGRVEQVVTLLGPVCAGAWLLISGPRWEQLLLVVVPITVPIARRARDAVRGPERCSEEDPGPSPS